MKHVYLLLAFISSFAVQAQSLCEDAAKGLQCHEVISKLPTAEVRGTCTGKFYDIPCNITYFSMKMGAGMMLTCGANPLKPDIQQFIPAQASTYSVSAIVTGEDGIQRAIHEDKVNTSFESELVLMKVGVNGETKAGSVKIVQEKGFEDLKDVQCK